MFVNGLSMIFDEMFLFLRWLWFGVLGEDVCRGFYDDMFSKMKVFMMTHSTNDTNILNDIMIQIFFRWLRVWVLWGRLSRSCGGFEHHEPSSFKAYSCPGAMVVIMMMTMVIMMVMLEIMTMTMKPGRPLRLIGGRGLGGRDVTPTQGLPNLPMEIEIRNKKNRKHLRWM